MTPLPKPSLLMLWIARLYALCFLALDFAKLLSYAGKPDTITYVRPAVSPGIGTTGSSGVIITHGPTASLCLMVAILACLSGGLLLIRYKTARVIVTTAAIVSIATTLYGVLYFLYMLISANSISPDFLHIKFLLILASFATNAIFQFLNIWLAFQPPENANRIDSGKLPPFASSQFST